LLIRMRNDLLNTILILAEVEQQHIRLLTKTVRYPILILWVHNVLQPGKIVEKNSRYIDPNTSILLNNVKTNQVSKMLNCCLI
jgi:hypothetical protein